MVMDITSRPTRSSVYRENGKSTDYSLKHVRELIEDYMPQRVIVEKQAMGAVIAEALQNILPNYAIETFNTSRPSKTVATDRILYLLERDELVIPRGLLQTSFELFSGRRTGSGKLPVERTTTLMALAFACSLIPDTPATASFFDNI